MDRSIEISLEKRQVSCIALLLDDLAPKTAETVWSALPLSGPVYHAKYARNEVYILAPPLSDTDPPLENPTITPIPGDVCFFAFSAGHLAPTSHGYSHGQGTAGLEQVVDLALFYGRNNLLINGDVGFVPGNVFATVHEGLPEMSFACNDIWLKGSEDERLTFRRASG